MKSKLTMVMMLAAAGITGKVDGMRQERRIPREEQPLPAKMWLSEAGAYMRGRAVSPQVDFGILSDTPTDDKQSDRRPIYTVPEKKRG
ncbi:MAG: hypothetical protein LBJ69_03510 [Holosporales bacterium]|jgi:hypothetical protein|nr:hypothetical protein [Holosporales bacterium]